LLQALTGDSVDGYPGCPGIGPKRAERLLNKETSWETVVAAYAKEGLDEEYALAQARVARILRWDEYNIKKEEVILWTPSKNQVSVQ